MVEDLAFLEGWGELELRDSVPFRWATDLTSSIEFELDAPARVHFIANTWSAPGLAAQSVRVEVNGVPVDELQPEPGWDPNRLVVELPQAATVTGTNRLELVHASSVRPTDASPDSKDLRELAAAWSDIRLEVHSPLALRGKQSGEGSIKLTPGDELHYYLRLPASGTLLVDATSTTENEGQQGGLQLLVHRGPASRPEPLTLHKANGTWSAEIGNSPDQPFRLTFRVADESPRGARIVAPRITFSAAESTDRQPQPAQRPNVLIYVVDTLRADYLSSYGNSRPLTPHFDQLADDGVRFSRAVAQSSWTRPSVASILTGLNPDSHGTENRDHKLSSQVAVLGEHLQRLGYWTAGFSTNGNVSAAFGFDRGFDTFISLPEEETDEIHHLSDGLHSAVLSSLRREDQEGPTGLYVHASDPHYPYTPKPAQRNRWAGDVPDPNVGLMASIQDLRMGRSSGDDRVAAQLRALYAAEIAFLDAQFGELRQQLESNSARPWFIVLVGDHGEEFLDHGGWTHGETLYAEQLRVPLIVHFPDGLARGSVYPGTARQVDILPTLLSYLGSEVPNDVDGRDLTVGLTSAEALESRPAFSSLNLDGWQIESVSVGGWKLIRSLHSRSSSYPSVELYNLRHDPRELHDLAEVEPLWKGYLESLLRLRRNTSRSTSEPRTEEMNEDIRRGLRALGYLN